MSKSWNKEELQAASEAMKKNGHMSYKEFCEALNGQENKTQPNKYWVYLENLRRSGVTNMWGAAPYLMKEFGLGEQTALNILVDWIKNYNREDYE